MAPSWQQGSCNCLLTPLCLGRVLKWHFGLLPTQLSSFPSPRASRSYIPLGLLRLLLPERVSSRVRLIALRCHFTTWLPSHCFLGLTFDSSSSLASPQLPLCLHPFHHGRTLQLPSLFQSPALSSSTPEYSSVPGLEACQARSSRLYSPLLIIGAWALFYISIMYLALTSTLFLQPHHLFTLAIPHGEQHQRGRIACWHAYPVLLTGATPIVLFMIKVMSCVVVKITSWY
ncbi:hypothetical protein BDN72DRAFT_291717 [Pluteus cervinus]|uniref:Uncharacterized protein n=1 Tax=Pluteus cervinus TaxID=181527 RepID=A0ACD3AED8_9AGAR|nr:hypothetical protein BDN72DRAFT_291717 [Pluteus cervinus]